MNEIFLDTSYAIAIASKKDIFRPRALQLAETIKASNIPLVTTQAVLLEIGNALAKIPQRQICINFLLNLENEPTTTILSLTDELYERAFGLFCDRLDKEWGLVDCISFIIMQDRNIKSALTADEHFIQAGFRALLRED